MPVSIHPSGFAVQYHENNTATLSLDNGGNNGYKNKRSRRARFYNVMHCLGSQKGFNTFWTFTVPKQQTNFKETDQFFTSKFSMLLESLRLRYKRHEPNGLADYVWVSEAQKRGNIHFHLVTSTGYLDVKHVRHQWTSLINDYSPNCIDVQRVDDYDSVNNIAAYFSKYMNKGHSLSKEEKIDLETGEVYHTYEKDRTIYAKTFGYSRNFDVYQPFTMSECDFEHFKADKTLYERTKTVTMEKGKVFDIKTYYLVSHKTYELCKNRENH